MPSEASEYALAYFANMADPDLAIYATHRLVRNVVPERIAALPTALSAAFEVERLADIEVAAEGVGAAVASVITSYLEANPRGAFGMWGPALGGAYGIRLADPQAIRVMEPEASEAYCALDVTILQDLVLQRGLDISLSDMAAGTHVAFYKDPAEAFERVADGTFQVGFFMNPTGLDQIREVALGGERMPQKATFFYPKLPTGLVFHDLNAEL
jgi:uncharacterized protein (DUF1015 family)